MVFDYLVQDVCLDAVGAVVVGATPVDGPARCPRHRDLQVGERLPYHKHDWSSAADRARLPDGYQRSDAFPIRTSRLGVAVVQSFDFGEAPRRFGHFDADDGGQIAVFSAQSVAYGVTEDGGGGLQFFYGADCAAPDLAARVRDSWIIVDRRFTADRAGEVVARLTHRLDRCPGGLGYALTRWHVRPLSLRVHVAQGQTSYRFAILVSDHFGGRTAALANHLERFYLTRELGLIRWERWENLERPGAPAVRAGVDLEARAAALASSDRCDAIAEPPAPSGRWLMIDCRQWTNLVGASDPAGDPPRFWIERLEAHPETRALVAD